MIYLIAGSVNLAGMLLIYSLMAYAVVRVSWHRRGVIAVLATIGLAETFWIAPAMIGFGYPFAASPGSYFLCFGNWLVSAFGIAFFCQTAGRIPRQLEDSARLDGCGRFGIYWHILLPLVRRELALLAILTVMATALLFWAALTAPDSAPLWPLFESLLGLRRLLQSGIGVIASTGLSPHWY